MADFRPLVVIPTYNESSNIGALLDDLSSRVRFAEILVVDDNSPDGTRDIVREKAKQRDGIFLLERANKAGLGRAYVAGFEWALNRGYSHVVQMDADFSHRVVDLLRMLDVARNADVVVGTRWISGGGTVNWGWFRKVLSRGGNLYARLALGYGLRDWTGGFNIWRRHVLEKIKLETLEAQGYVFQVELKYRALKLNFQPIEVPIIFEERRAGQSKMSLRIIIEAWIRVWRLRNKH